MSLPVPTDEDAAFWTPRLAEREELIWTGRANHQTAVRGNVPSWRFNRWFGYVGWSNYAANLALIAAFLVIALTSDFLAWGALTLAAGFIIGDVLGTARRRRIERRERYALTNQRLLIARPMIHSDGVKEIESIARADIKAVLAIPDVPHLHILTKDLPADEAPDRWFWRVPDKYPTLIIGADGAALAQALGRELAT